MTSVDFESRVENEIRKIRESEELLDEDKELLLDFKRDKKLDGVSNARIRKLLTHTRIVAEYLDTSFGDATEDDLKDLVEWIQDRDLSPITKSDYRQVLKQFYSWMNNGECPEKAKWIDASRKRRNDKLPKELLTEDDVQDMIEAAENPRDRAFVAITWETGSRIGEIMDMKVGSIEDHEYGKKIVIGGKTGARRLPLISSIPHVQNWLLNHPKKEKPEAPLWCKLTGENAGTRVSYRYLRKMLQRIAEKSGVNKPVNPHHFRHSRATYLASKMTESQLCEWFGWVQGSNRPQDYVHMSGRDIDTDYARLHGIKAERKREESKMSPRECPRCEKLNDTNAKVCQRCGLVFDEKVAMETEKKKAMGEMIMEKAGESEEEGTLEELIDKAVEEKVKEVLSEE